MNPLHSQSFFATLTDGEVHVHFRMGLADGFTLLSRRSSERDYSEIAEDEPTPVVDARPKLDASRPEVRFYRAILRYTDRQSCRPSKEIKLTVP